MKDPEPDGRAFVQLRFFLERNANNQLNIISKTIVLILFHLPSKYDTSISLNFGTETINTAYDLRSFVAQRPKLLSLEKKGKDLLNFYVRIKFSTTSLYLRQTGTKENFRLVRTEVKHTLFMTSNK
jgi:hypothetical protein